MGFAGLYPTYDAGVIQKIGSMVIIDFPILASPPGRKRLANGAEGLAQLGLADLLLLVQDFLENAQAGHGIH